VVCHAASDGSIGRARNSWIEAKQHEAIDIENFREAEWGAFRIVGKLSRILTGPDERETHSIHGFTFG